ncbi:MAG: hypothetical protein ACD_10C00513G0002 [uncultured bacterium]|nr:MAG: hypothetical protein ACD_10C00513G0002 [uncultured bacterium]
MAHDCRRIQRFSLAAIFIHDTGEQILVKAAPIDTNAHRLVVLAGQFDHLGKLLVLFLAKSYITRIDPILGERFGASRMIDQQAMTVVMKVTD